MIHGHVTAWVLALILFIVAIFLLKGWKRKRRENCPNDFTCALSANYCNRCWTPFHAV